MVEIKRIKVFPMIYLYRSNLGSNTYYIDDKVKLLIDCGTFVKEKVDMIILTHCHFDHLLFLKEIKEKNDCKVMCGENDKKFIENLSEEILPSLSPKSLLPIKIDETLKDGEEIVTGKYKFKILETPGHTAGSISLFEERNGILFSGDTWFGDDIFGRYDLPSGNEKELFKSIKRLKSLKIKILCPGHSDVVKLEDK